MLPSGFDALAQMGLRQNIASLSQRKRDTWECYMNGTDLFSLPEPEREGPNAIRG